MPIVGRIFDDNPVKVQEPEAPIEVQETEAPAEEKPSAGKNNKGGKK